jgi:hypothetical protein
MGGFVINSTVNSSANDKKTIAGFIGEKSGLGYVDRMPASALPEEGKVPEPVS